MRSYSLKSVVVVAAFTFSAGVGASTLFNRQFAHAASRNASGAHASSKSEASTQRGAAIPEEQVAVLKSVARLLEKSALEKKFDAEDPNSFGKLHELARTDASVRSELMKRYLSAPEGDARDALQQLLTNLHSPDVVNFAMDLAKNGTAQDRQHGFELLAGLGMKLPEVRGLAKQTLVTEKDPAILSHAIATLRPSFEDSAEDEALQKQLQGFSQHQDPVVRTQAVSALAALDKTGSSADALQQALSDTSEEVRSAAAAAIAENRIRTPGLKDKLIAMVGDSEESAANRLSAARALERYALDNREASLVLNSAKEADRELYGDADSFEPIQRDADQRY